MDLLQHLRSAWPMEALPTIVTAAAVALSARFLLRGGRDRGEKSPFHPELAAAARFLPYGLGRPHTRWLLDYLTWLIFSAVGFPKERAVTPDGVQVFCARDYPGPGPTLLWIHGGGLIFGDPRQDADFLKRVNAELGMHVVSVGYRVAPAHPFPAPLDDCARAFAWAVAQDWVKADELIVGGSSAGGGLAAVLCQRLAREGGQQPLAQLLVYPMLDDRSSERSAVPDEALRTWDRASNRYGWDSYLAGHDRDAPPDFAVPGRTPSLSGVPPAWIGVGTLDLFYEADKAYAARLEAAGIPAQLEVVEGAFHAFEAVVKDAPVSQAFVRAKLDFLRRVLA